VPLSTRIRNHIRRNLYGLVAIFIALGGTATASHLVVRASDIKKNAVRAKHIKRGAVKKPKLAARSVTSPKLALGAVTTPSLADDAVISTKVADGSLGGADIANGSIGLFDLGASSVDSSKVGDSSLTGADIANGSIGLSDLGASSVNSSKVANNSLTGTDINEGTLDFELEAVTASSANNSNSPKRIFPLACPPGKFVLDVGAQIHGGTSGAGTAQLSEVVITELVNGGIFAAVTAFETDGFAGNWQLEAGVICARLAF
jgi:hypothetical protein